MELKAVFEKIDFVNRYQKICEQHNDFDNRMTGSNKKLYSQILDKMGISYTYSSKDKTFKTNFNFKEHALDLVISLHGGHIQTHLNYLKNGEWLLFDRFDGYAEKLSTSFNREIFNIPKYTSEDELEIILKDIFSIYEDLKEALVAHLDKA